MPSYTTMAGAEAAIQRAIPMAFASSCGWPMTCTPTAPSGFERLFPATGGALYGRSNHGFMGTFERGGNTSSIPGLYFVGGSVHPGAGVPMAVLSGRLCAARVVDDRFGRSPGKEKYVSVRVG